MPIAQRIGDALRLLRFGREIEGVAYEKPRPLNAVENGKGNSKSLELVAAAIGRTDDEVLRVARWLTATGTTVPSRLTSRNREQIQEWQKTALSSTVPNDLSSHGSGSGSSLRADPNVGVGSEVERMDHTRRLLLTRIQTMTTLGELNDMLAEALRIEDRRGLQEARARSDTAHNK